MKFSLNPFVLCFLLCLTISYAEEEAAAATGSEGESGGGGAEAAKGGETGGEKKEGEPSSSTGAAPAGGEETGEKKEGEPSASPVAAPASGGAGGASETAAVKSAKGGQKSKNQRCTAVPDSCTGKTWKWIHDATNGTCTRRQVGNCARRSGFHLCPICVSTCLGNTKNVNDICKKKG